MILVVDEKAAEAQRLDELYDKLSIFVCEQGPKLLTRGMSPGEANEAILECLMSLLSRATLWEHEAKCAESQKAGLLKKLQIANQIIDSLRDYSAGMSVLAEEAVKKLLEAFDARN